MRKSQVAAIADPPHHLGFFSTPKEPTENLVFGKRSAQAMALSLTAWTDMDLFEVRRKLTSTHQANVFAYLCFMLLCFDSFPDLIT